MSVYFHVHPLVSNSSSMVWMNKNKNKNKKILHHYANNILLKFCIMSLEWSTNRGKLIYFKSNTINLYRVIRRKTTKRDVQYWNCPELTTLKTPSFGFGQGSAKVKETDIFGGWGVCVFLQIISLYKRYLIHPKLKSIFLN